MIFKTWSQATLLSLLALVVMVGCEDDPKPYCPIDFKMCDDTCFNIKVDSNNCGDCDTKCNAGETCLAGKCSAGCGGGATDCSSKCVDVKSDPKNCGACDTTCRAGEVCSQGKCLASCLGGTTNCSGKCVDITLDPKNCGTCDTTCKTGEVCSAGKCGTSCLGGASNCSNKCVDTLLDPSNCGACGVICKTGQVCSAGKCSLTCVGGATKCGKYCVDTLVNPKNCGACDNLCKTGEVCSAGKCGLTCVGGTTKCGNFCVDTQNDTSNCGSCSAACKTGEVCSAGKCGLTCVGGTTNCLGKCVDTLVDPKNCGACGTLCISTCASGKCLCGDGTIQPGEWCDGVNLGGQSCSSTGYSLGTLKCKTDCTLDNTGCTWAKRFGGTNSDVDEAAVAADSKGNSIVTAEFTGSVPFGSNTLISKGGQDVLVAKVDADGKPVWAVSAGSIQQDQGDAVAVDAMDNVYVLGNYRGNVSFGGKLLIVQTPLKQTSFVWKLDSKGNTAWAASVQGSEDNEGSRIAVDSAGNSYITGYFKGKARFGSVVINSAGGFDGYVAKLDKLGKFVWAKGFGGTLFDRAEGVTVDGTGNVYVSGTFQGTATFGATITATSSGDSDAFVLKLGGKGKVLWLATGGGTSFDDAEGGVGVDSAGNVYVSGEVEGNATFGTTNLTVSGNQDAYLWKLDKSGKHLWAVQSKSNASASTKGLVVDTLGNSYICGYHTGETSFDTIKVPHMDDDDVFVAKLDKDGKFLWARAGGSPQDATCYGLALGPNDRLHAAGDFEQYLTLGAKTLVSAKLYSGRTDEDFFVWTLPTK